MARRVLPTMAVILFLVLALPVFGQVRSGTITGTVTDSTGALVPAAQVTVLNQDTNVSIQVSSGAAGEYTAPYLATGKYTVLVKKDGFQPYRKTDISMGTAQTVRIDAALSVGKVDSVVEIKADAVQMQTENATVQGSVDNTIIAAIPNNTNNPLLYAVLQAGVIPRAQMLDSTSAAAFGIGWESRRQFSAFNINGGAAFTNDIQLDGLSVQGSAWNEAAVLPNTDALQEVRVIANNFSAEYGRGQGVVSMITKSGTNQLHGGLNYTLRNEAFNANTFGNNAQGIPRGPFKVNQFGGNAGGAIIKDKLFFFGSYSRLIHSDPANWLLTIPTADERKGNFANTLIRDNNGNPVPVTLFNPFDVKQVGPNQYQRMPVPGSVVANPSPYALKLYEGFPEPNRTADDPFGSNNFFTQKTRQFRRNSFNSRVDYQMGKHSIYGSGGLEQGTINTPRPFGADSPFFQPPSNGWSAENNRDRNPYAAIGDTIVVNPTLVLDLRYGINRINNDSVSGENSTFDYDSYGTPKKVQAVMPYPGVAIDILFPERYSAANLTMYQQKRERQTNHTMAASATKTLNKWTLKAGSEYRVYLSNYTDFEDGAVMGPGGWNGAGGNFTSEFADANGNGTSLNTKPQQNGFGGAAPMFGAGSWSLRSGFPVRPAFAQKLFALYSQNDWKATSRLTVNLGLRWEIQPGPTERHDRISSIDFDAANPYFGKAKYVFAGTEGYSRNLWDTTWKNFQPRVGAAYRVSDTLVLRGGFGRTYLPTNTGYYNGPFTYGAGNFSPWIEPRIFGTNPNGAPVGKFWEDSPANIIPSAGATQAPSMYGPYAYMFDRRMPNAYSDQWSFFVEKQLTKSWFASAGYSASRGRDLLNGRFTIQDMQVVPDSTLNSWKQTFVATNGVQNPAYDQVTNPYQPTDGSRIAFGDYLGNSTINRFQTLYPYPILGNMSLQATNGYSNYHSLQLHLNHAMSNGFQLQAHYTWSKALEFTQTELQGNQGFNNTSGGGGYDLRNLANNKQIAASDIPHRFIAVFTWDTPFGKGKALDVQKTALRAVLGNWTLGGVYTAESGLPWGAGGFDGSLNGRGDRVAGADVEVPADLQRWYDGNTKVTLPGGRVITPCNRCFLKYNPDLFQGRVLTLPDGNTVADQFWYGTAARTYSDLRGFGRNNIDLTINRQFNITERFQLMFVANMTNALNHTQFVSNSFNTGTGTVTSADPASGLKVGMNNNSNFGTHGLDTYEPRQVVFNLRLRF